MRLIDTTTVELAEFMSDEAPEYAILSHTWGNDEVSLADFNKLEKRSSTGFLKIQRACSLAKGRGHQYIWIDTCCIDKSSSAELTEAINSMFNWYAQAQQCIAYLADVGKDIGDAEFEDEFRKSRWFTRGWTLQELIAPINMIFYGRSWNELGTKDQLRQRIWSITRIRSDCLSGGRDALKLASVAQIMFWMSGRRTTRAEDRAYSLMGLLDVNMPLLYGEGAEKAFFRLQLGVIQDSSDESIFAWSNSEREGPIRGMFAQSPDDFMKSADVVPADILPLFQRAPYRYTNKGLEFEIVQLKSDAKHHPPDQNSSLKTSDNRSVIVPLNCRRSGAKNTAICVTLAYISRSPKFVERTNIELLASVRFDATNYQDFLPKPVLVLGEGNLRKLSVLELKFKRDSLDSYKSQRSQLKSDLFEAEAQVSKLDLILSQLPQADIALDPGYTKILKWKSELQSKFLEEDSRLQSEISHLTQMESQPLSSDDES